MRSSAFSILSGLFGGSCSSTREHSIRNLPPVLKNDDSESSGVAFCPIKKSEEDLAKKLQELDSLKKEFFDIHDLIYREKVKEKAIEEKTELKIVIPAKKINEEKTPVPSRHVHPTEKLIEDCIHQTRSDIQEDISALKSEAKLTDDYLRKCDAAIRITEKLAVMIHKIHLTIAKPLERTSSLPMKLENSLEVVVSMAPDKVPALEAILKIVKLANILLKQPKDMMDEKLFLNVEKGITDTILFLNDDFIQLQILKEELQKKFHVLAEPNVVPKEDVRETTKPIVKMPTNRDKSHSMWASEGSHNDAAIEEDASLPRKCSFIL